MKGRKTNTVGDLRKINSFQHYVTFMKENEKTQRSGCESQPQVLKYEMFAYLGS